MKNIKRFVLSGILIWVILFAVASALIGFKTNSTAMGIIISVAVLILSVLFSKKLQIKNQKEAIWVALIWFLSNIILDLLITTRFTGLEIFTHWTYWVSYLLLILPPI